MQAVKLPKGLLELWILYLSSKYPVSPIEAARKAAEATNGAWRPSPGSLYPLIRRMSEEGLLFSTSNGYIATDSGKAMAERLLKETIAARSIIDAVISAVNGSEAPSR